MTENTFRLTVGSKDVISAEVESMKMDVMARLEFLNRLRRMFCR